MNGIYLPWLSDARFVRSYFFRHAEHGPCSVVLVTECKSDSLIQYTHVMFVYEQGDFLTGKACFAVASEVNRLASPGEERSHFLGVFTSGAHLNYGASRDWADLEKFTDKALQIIKEHFSLEKAPVPIEVPAMMLQKFRPPRITLSPNQFTPTRKKTKKWWQFWK